MGELYGEFSMGPLKRVTGGRDHKVPGAEPVGAYALKIAVIGDKDGLEYILGEMEDGSERVVVLSGTALEGWVIEALYSHGATVFLGSWVELGMRNGDLYIELLMSSHDFDLVHAERLLRQQPSEYRAWKSRHRVPRIVDHSGELYYGRIEAAMY